MIELTAKPVIKTINQEILSFISNLSFAPRLNIIRINNDPASEYYVTNLVKKGEKIGINVDVINMPLDTDEKDVLQLIRRFNDDRNVNAIMIQKPLPGGFNEDILTGAIDPDKDVDGFHPVNMGKLLLEKDGLKPCTPLAVIETLRHYNITTRGKRVVIIGRSNIVGKPLAGLLLYKDLFGDATVTICHSRSEKLSDITKEADILIAATGKAEFVNKDMLKSNSIVIDVGINQIVRNGKTSYVGDVDFNSCSKIAQSITPVPGGIGTVTTAMLLKNVIKAVNIQNKVDIFD
ncbi:MAG: bifunctional 5,10-methylenetetrahydrofolate dehydrogenase/5,10-methenyltetrahydrofolate cyclohydrolase [Candidatus Cloacimonetes bacterium]|nr:bifunctional 5,10-methylenetetrahydrofolate dehydrogenase/5,10-methenyltetrahydrofolate cyclohydrolase [Candidatus Cloacimonadota bacterium]